MSILFRRAVAIPVWAVWAVALGVGALTAPPPVTAALVVLLGLALIGSSALVLVRRKSRPPRIEVLPALDLEPAPAGIIVSAGARARTLNQAMNARNVEIDDAADLIRMDGDAG